MIAAELVTLRDGDGASVVVNADAISLVLRLQDAGISLVLDGPDLVALPGSLVTPDDAALLRLHVVDLKRIVRVIDNPPEIM